jgi:hypothetical protein
MKTITIAEQFRALGNIKEQLPIITQNSPTAWTIGNLQKFRELTKRCLYLPGVKLVAAEVERTHIFTSARNDMQVDINVVNETQNCITKLVASIESLRGFFKDMELPTLDANQISVRLSHVDSLTELSMQIEILEKALSQTILDAKLGGKLEVAAVDNGSVWLLLIVGTPAAVTFIGGLAWAAVVVYKKAQEGLLVQQHVESLKIKNDALGQIREAQGKLLNEMVEAEARHLEMETFGEDANPDRLKRIEFAIESLQKLIEKGAEIHPALNAPEDVKNLFPNFKKLGLVESKIKQISEKSAD